MQVLLNTELFPTQNLFIADKRKQGVYVRYTSETQKRETRVKVPKFMLSVTKGVFDLRH